MRILLTVTSLSHFAVFNAGSAAGQARLWEEPGPCDRNCLIGMADAYITAIDLQRVWIADEVTGLVFSLSFFRHAFETDSFQVDRRDGEITDRQMNCEPFDFPAVHIQKMENYRISDQEGMGLSMPYRSTNGWNPFWR